MGKIENRQEIDWQKLLPQDFQVRMQQMLGEEYEAFLASYREERRPGLRLNTLKKGWESLEEQIRRGSFDNGKAVAAEAENADSIQMPIPWAPHGFYYPIDARPGRHPYHEAGVYYIQEPSAMAVAALSGVRPGQWVLDLCAAPGGKSTQIASMLRGEGVLISNEIHPARAKILSQNIERLGIRNAIVTNESPESLARRFPSAFDIVLADAPCSGEGMFCKEEAAIPNWSPENVDLCARRQREILDFAAEMTADGGALVYSTCTFSPEEDEGTVAAFLCAHPEFSAVDLPAELGEDFLLRTGIVPGNPAWVNLRTGTAGFSDSENEMLRPQDLFPVELAQKTRCALRLWPHKLEGEGHFLAVFRKEGEVIPRRDIPDIQNDKRIGTICGNRREKKADRHGKDGGRGKSALTESIGSWRVFARETLSEKAFEKIERAASQGRFLAFGRELYVLPFPFDMEGLKVLRPGFHLGTMKKDRFEPSHALALALSAEEVRCCAEVKSAGAANRYLHGETLSAEGENADGSIVRGSKGWCLLTIDGFSLGWGKLVGGQIKNHYPRGLRH